eukprot:TRINITY_DN10425_c0_g1_i4.p1 TRINITY_DN10425_c0_g1~~TRINITY_DN10425_c0_g1_i4.p1  ORF type:complete len:268 (-),score=55.16 TRINITY_DN10425_c0_g1_i4:12-815(-)
MKPYSRTAKDQQMSSRVVLSANFLTLLNPGKSSRRMYRQDGQLPGRTEVRRILTARCPRVDINFQQTEPRLIAGLSVIGFNSNTAPKTNTRPLKRPYTGLTKTHQDPFLMRQGYGSDGVPVAIRVRENLRPLDMQRPDTVKLNSARLLQEHPAKFIARHNNVINVQNLMTRLPYYFTEEMKVPPEFQEACKDEAKKESVEEEKVKKEVRRKRMEGKSNGKRRVVIFKEKVEVIGKDDSLDLSNIKSVNKVDNDSFEMKTDLMTLLKE